MNYRKALVVGVMCLFMVSCSRMSSTSSTEIVATSTVATPPVTTTIVISTPGATGTSTGQAFSSPAISPSLSLTNPDQTATSIPVATATSLPGATHTSTAVPSPTITPLSDQVLKFGGEVSREQVFEYKIGPNLYFQLRPTGYGWKVWIGNKSQPFDNYVGVVTPPYHGMNAIYIEGWHFRNSDNTGPNVPGEKLVNAPQKVRRFYFILNEEDHQIAYNSLNLQLFPEEEHEQIWKKREQLEPREGQLTITKLELGNLVPGEDAWIENMEFEVELSLPSNFQ